MDFKSFKQQKILRDNVLTSIHVGTNNFQRAKFSGESAVLSLSSVLIKYHQIHEHQPHMQYQNQ